MSVPVFEPLFLIYHHQQIKIANFATVADSTIVVVGERVVAVAVAAAVE